MDDHPATSTFDVIHIAALKAKAACSEELRNTLPETNIAPKNGWLEYYFPIGEAYFQGLC